MKPLTSAPSGTPPGATGDATKDVGCPSLRPSGTACCLDQQYYALPRGGGGVFQVLQQRGLQRLHARPGQGQELPCTLARLIPWGLVCCLNRCLGERCGARAPDRASVLTFAPTPPPRACTAGCRWCRRRGRDVTLDDGGTIVLLERPLLVPLAVAVQIDLGADHPIAFHVQVDLRGIAGEDILDLGGLVFVKAQEFSVERAQRSPRSGWLPAAIAAGDFGRRHAASRSRCLAAGPCWAAAWESASGRVRQAAWRPCRARDRGPPVWWRSHAFPDRDPRQLRPAQPRITAGFGTSCISLSDLGLGWLWSRDAAHQAALNRHGAVSAAGTGKASVRPLVELRGEEIAESLALVATRRIAAVGDAFVIDNQVAATGPAGPSGIAVGNRSGAIMARPAGPGAAPVPGVVDDLRRPASRAGP